MNSEFYNVLAFIFYIVGFGILRVIPGNSTFLFALGIVFIIAGIVLSVLGGGFNQENSQGIGLLGVNEGKAEARRRRVSALNHAQIYMLPYNDIWRNLTLSNKYCSLKLRADGETLIGTEKVRNVNSKGRSFRITNPGILDTNELFNMFCLNFEYNTSYDGLIELCNRCRATVVETGPSQLEISKNKPEAQKTTTNTPLILIPEEDKTDINNCSEIELTALPGISIVIAKKIIRRREEIKGFKSVDDFITFVNLKPNITNQLRQMIVVNKMKGSLNLKRNKERTIDL